MDEIFPLLISSIINTNGVEVNSFVLLILLELAIILGFKIFKIDQ